MAASTQPPAAPARKGGALRSPVTWVIVLGIALAGGAFILIRRRSSPAAGTSTDTQATPAGTVGPDWSGEIATLQTEIMDLQSSEAQDKDTDTDTDKDTDTDQPGKVTVPPVTGTKAVQAQKVLADAGLRSTLTGPPFTGRGGAYREITAQSPKAGAKVNRGTTVRLTYRIQGGAHKPPAGKPPAPKPPAGKPPAPKGVGPGAPIKRKAPPHHTTRKAAA